MSMNRKNTWVSIKDRHYSVTFDPRDDGSEVIYIQTQWEVIDPSTVWSVHPSHFTVSKSVDPYGRLGRKVVKLARDAITNETANG
jgi:hypothetical protein